MGLELRTVIRLNECKIIDRRTGDEWGRFETACDATMQSAKYEEAYRRGFADGERSNWCSCQIESDAAAARKQLDEIRSAIRQSTAAVGALDGISPAPPPKVAIRNSRPMAAIPEKSGVYFVYEAGSVVYVGQSKCLRMRLRIGHHAINAGEMVSWICTRQQDRLFTELIYIGIYRPRRNGVGKKQRPSRNR